MQWSFTSARPLSPAAPGVLKRPLSSGSLAALAAQAKQPRLAAVAAAQQQPGGAAAASGEAPMAVDSAAGLPQDVDVAAVAAKHGWDITQQNHDWSGDRQVRWLRVDEIRRPLQGSRSNDPEKVAALMQSIQEIGLQEPIDVLEVEGRYWGFSGCHRYEAHQRLGKQQILCRVRKATPQVLKFHMM